MIIKGIQYTEGQLTLLDQTALPHQTRYITYTDYEEIAEAIETMIVRGAPAIGITAAYGVLVAAEHYQHDQEFILYMEQVIERLWNTRPTAVNLMWALERMKPLITEDVEATINRLKKEAEKIYKDDIVINRQIGEHLLGKLFEGAAVLTHCNPGALATAGYGTATAPFYLAKERGINIRVYSDETRPRLQGALTAYELQQAGIDVTTITDSTAATLMQQERIDAVIVGCDRIAANGDTVNKIGTMPLAVCAHYYQVPFYVAAPTPSFDLATASGKEIPIEERDAAEVTLINQTNLTAPDIKVYNPAFDITPNQLITEIVTEYGEVQAEAQAIKQLFETKVKR